MNTRIEKAQAKIADLKKVIAAEKSKASGAQRKADANYKILAGVVLLDKIFLKQSEPWRKYVLNAMLEMAKNPLVMTRLENEIKALNSPLETKTQAQAPQPSTISAPSKTLAES